MTADFILRHFAGFALQLMPATALLLLSFDRERFRFRPGKTWSVFVFTVLGLSAVYAGTVYALQLSRPALDGAGFLFGNLFLCGSILVIACLFFLLIREEPLRKGFLFFTAIAFAAIQYSLTNIVLSFTPAKPVSQAGQSYDINTCVVYLLVTAVLIPPVAVFFRRSMRLFLRSIRTASSRGAMMLLLVMTVLYLVLNALLSMVTPDTLCSTLATLTSGESCMACWLITLSMLSEFFTSATALRSVRLLLKPVTTTSPNCLASSSMSIVSCDGVLMSTVTSLVL